MSKKKILFVFGTRPEAIKLAPLIKSFQNDLNFNIEICVTAQHKVLLQQVLKFFNIQPDYNLKLMQPYQTLFEITTHGLDALKKILEESKPDLVVVQGDTTSAFIGALAAYYKKIKVAHVEAGLRSDDKYSPFPEEINRALISRIADYHFAPTQTAVENLSKENVTKNVWMVGNTVIDALFESINIFGNGNEAKYKEFFSFLDFSKKIILVTGHRRESFGKPLSSICSALKELANRFEDVQIVYPLHLNPHVELPVKKLLKNIDNIFLLEPITYPYLIWLMKNSYLVITDSGGLQEEAPALNKPVLVIRDVTERMEGIKAGTAKLVGTKKSNIVRETSELLKSEKKYLEMKKAVNPYGDGQSVRRIVEIINNVMV
jgi:UDP-N-acetylglucosamine 2-epimerase (non-hydrolysing)